MTEGGTPPSNLTVTAQLFMHDSTATSGEHPLDLAISVASRSSAGTQDYAVTQALPLVISIPANSLHRSTHTAVLAGLSITDDSIVEGTETIILAGALTPSASDPATTFEIMSTTVAIIDSDTANIVVAGPNAPIVEGQPATFVVRVDQQLERAIILDWTVTAADQLLLALGAVTIGPSIADDPVNVVVHTWDDEVTETDTEVGINFAVRGSEISGAVAAQVHLPTTHPHATAIINASDPLTVTLTGPSTVFEGQAEIYSLVVSGGISRDAIITTVDIAATSTAVAQDMTPAIPATFTIPAGNNRVGFTINFIDELGAREGIEHLLLSATSTGGGGPTIMAGPHLHTSIHEKVTVELSLDRTTIQEDAVTTTVTVTATLRTPSAINASVPIDLNFTGTAITVLDYTTNPGPHTIRLAPGATDETTGSIELGISPQNDDTVEGIETVLINGTTTNATVDRIIPATLQLLPGLVPDVGTITITDAPIVDESYDAIFAATFSRAIGADVVLHWAAVEGADDLARPSGTVRLVAPIAANVPVTFPIATQSDVFPEPAETFRLRLQVDGPAASYLTLPPDPADHGTGTIGPSDNHDFRSDWTAMLQLKRLDVPPPGYNRNRAYATTDQETHLEGAVLVDRADFNTTTLRVGLFLQLETNGADPTEGISTNLVDRDYLLAGLTPGDIIIGLDGVQLAVDYAGTGPGFVAEEVDAILSPSYVPRDAQPYFDSALILQTLPGSNVQKNATVPMFGRFNIRPDNSYYLLLSIREELSPFYFRGVWCPPVHGTCEVLLGILNIPLSGIPQATETLAIGLSSPTTSDTVPTVKELVAMNGRANLIRRVGEPVTYQFCSDAGCPSTYVSFRDREVTVVEGGSADVCIAFANYAPTTEALSIPVVRASGAQGGTAMAASYTLSHDAVTVPAGQQNAVACLTVTAVDNPTDPVDSADEIQSVVLTHGPLPAGIEPAPEGITMVTVNLVDNDAPAVTVHLDVAGSITAASEGTNHLGWPTVQVTVDIGPTGQTMEEPLELELLAEPKDGSSPSDFEIHPSIVRNVDDEVVFRLVKDVNSGNHIITLGPSISGTDDRMTFNVQAVDDPVAEVGESVRLGLNPNRLPVGRDVRVGRDAIIPLLDNDINVMRLSLNTDTVSEGTASPPAITIQAELSLDTNTPTAIVGDVLSLVIAVQGDSTAIANTDYRITDAAPYTITIPASATHNSIHEVTLHGLSALSDAAIEGVEHIIFGGKVTDSNGHTLSNVGVIPAALAIADMTHAQLTIAAPQDPVVEGELATFTLTADREIAGHLILEWMANSHADDLALSSGAVTIGPLLAGQQAAISIPTRDDSLSEMDETPILSFTTREAASGNTITEQIEFTPGVNSRTMTIAANDPLVVTLSGPDWVREDRGGTWSATVIGGLGSADILVTLALAPTSSATLADLTGGQLPSITIPAGQGNGNVPIEFVRESQGIEGLEMLILQIDQVTGGDGIISAATTTVTTTISDAPAIRITSTTIRVTEGGTADVVVALTDEIAQPVNVVWHLTPDTASVADFITPVTGRLLFTGSPEIRTIAVTARDDSLAEKAELFTVSIQIADSGIESVVVVDPATATVAGVVAADERDALVLSLEGPQTAIEEGTHGTYTLRLSGGVSTRVVSATIAVVPTTAQAADFRNVPTKEIIPAGHSSTTFTIDVVDDYPESDPNETFEVWISNPLGGGGAVNPTVAVANVQNTITQIPDILVSPIITTVNESAGTVQFDIRLSDGISFGGPVSVRWATVPGTARSPEDFEGQSGTVSFRADAPVADRHETIIVQLQDDDLSEQTEGFTVQLSDLIVPTVEAVRLATTTATATIIDDDDIVVALTGPESVVECDTAEYKLTVTGGVSTELIFVSLARGVTSTADAEDINPALPTAVGIPANESLMVLETQFVRERSTVEGTENLVLQIESVGGGSGNTTAPIAPIVTQIHDVIPSWDINRDGTLDTRDALGTYYAVEFSWQLGTDTSPLLPHHAIYRQMLLANLLPRGAPRTRENMRQLLANVRDLTAPCGATDLNSDPLDWDADGGITANDAVILYYALGFPELVGIGPDAEPQGFAEFRRVLFRDRLGFRPGSADSAIQHLLGRIDVLTP